MISLITVVEPDNFHRAENRTKQLSLFKAINQLIFGGFDLFTNRFKSSSRIVFYNHVFLKLKISGNRSRPSRSNQMCRGRKRCEIRGENDPQDAKRAKYRGRDRDGNARSECL